MRDEDEDSRFGGGRGTLLAAWFALLVVLGAAFGYAFLVPSDTSEMDRLGSVVVPLNQAASDTRIDADTGSGQAAETDANDAGASETVETTQSTDTPESAQDAPESGASQTASLPEPPATDAETASGAQASGQPTDSQDAPETQAAPEAGNTANASDPDATQTARRSLPEAPDSEAAAPRLAPPDKPAWQRFANVLNPPEGIPRIAVIVRGLGLSSAATEAAVKRLPAEISLSFSPYARRAVEWSLRARARGHEVLVDLPMEPESFPASDPGPRALMTALPTPTNMERLDWALSQAREVVGVLGQMGSAFVKSRRAVEPVLRHLKNQGRLYVDNGDVPDNAALTVARGLDLPHAVSDRVVDSPQVSRPAIEARLIEAERLAQQNGVAVVLAHPYPVTIDLLSEWSRNVDDRGMALVPITNALAGMGPTEAAGLR